jgi:molybdopterin molybdotransferase
LKASTTIETLALDPLEALRVVTTQRRSRHTRPMPVSECPPGCHLREPVASVAPGTVHPAAGDAPARYAIRNGFALPAGVRLGDECRIVGTLAPGALLDADGEAPPPAAGPEVPEAPEEAGAETASGGPVAVWRVETGAELPPGTESVLPVTAAVLVGTRRLRVLEVPSAGDGVSSPSRRASAPVFPPGTRLGGRLRALLLARGASEVDVWPPFAVGVAALGDELVDLGAGHRPGAWLELTAFWLPEAITALGLSPLPLGILPDSPTRFREVLLHAIDRKVAAVVACGGLGDGVRDRTVEALRRFGAGIIFERVNVVGASGLLFAKTQGIDVFVLGGRPLEAAAGFDLFVRAALLSRAGSSRRRSSRAPEAEPRCAPGRRSRPRSPSPPARKAGRSSESPPGLRPRHPELTPP